MWPPHELEFVFPSKFLIFIIFILFTLILSRDKKFLKRNWVFYDTKKLFLKSQTKSVFRKFKYF